MSVTITFKKNFPKRDESRAYSEAGLTFTNSAGNKWGSPYPNDFVGVPFDPARLYVAPDVKGTTFNCVSFQFCSASPFVPAQFVRFTGVTASGESLIDSIGTRDRSSNPVTWSPANFIDLVSLTVELGAVAFGNFIYDPIPVQTVKFAGLPSGAPPMPAVYEEAGLTFTNSSNNLWANPVSNEFVAIYGTPGYLYVVPGDGQRFDFKSLDVCNFNPGVPGQSVVFTGKRFDGQTVTHEFTTPGYSITPITCAPEDFAGLVHLSVFFKGSGFLNLVFAGPY